MSTADAAPTYIPFRRTLIHLAGDLLTRRPGDRLPPGEEYQRQLGVGSGTFLRALRTLEELGAVAVESHGYRGTVLVSRDVSALWRTAERAPVRVAFTPPGAPDHYGLAVGCIEELRRCGLTVNPMFAWSGAVRGRWLTEGHVDVAVVSLAAARSVQAIEPKIAVRDASPVVYYASGEVVVVSAAAAGTRLRVRVDNSSPDHIALTQREFADVDGVEWVQCRFRDVPAQILTGQIDAGVWHRIDAPISPELAGLVVRARKLDGKSMSESETAAWCYPEDAADIEAVCRAARTRAHPRRRLHRPIPSLAPRTGHHKPRPQRRLTTIGASARSRSPFASAVALGHGWAGGQGDKPRGAGVRFDVVLCVLVGASGTGASSQDEVEVESLEACVLPG